VLGNDRLRLVKTTPQIRDTRFLFPGDTTQETKAHRMAADFEFLGALIDVLFGATIRIIRMVGSDIHVYIVL